MFVRPRFLVAPLVTVLLLTGCAPAPAPAESDGPVVTPTPTPTVSQPTEPQSILPLDCADIYAPDDIQAHFEESIKVRVDQTTAPDDTFPASTVQQGALACVWAGKDRTDSGWDQGLTLTVYGNGADGYAGAVADGPTGGDIQTGTIGDDSVTNCYSGGDWYQCFADVLVGDYWIHTVTGDHASLSLGDTYARLDEVLTPIVDAVQGAGEPRPVWVVPADAYAGDELCDDPTAAAAALGLAVGKLSPGERSTDGDERRCVWNSKQNVVIVNVLRGGSWALERHLQQPELKLGGLQSPPEVIELAGTDAAMISCGDGCIAQMSVGGSRVTLYLQNTFDLDDAKSQVADFAAAAFGA